MVRFDPINGMSPYEWTELEQGIILSSYYWGYIVSYYPGKKLSEIIGSKFVIIIGTSLASIATIAIPFIPTSSNKLCFYICANIVFKN